MAGPRGKLTKSLRCKEIVDWNDPQTPGSYVHAVCGYHYYTLLRGWFFVPVPSPLNDVKCAGLFVTAFWP